MHIWDEPEDHLLIDYLFETNLPHRDIARKMDLTEAEIRLRVKELNLQWVKRSKNSASRGQSALTAIMRKLLPGQKIVNEHHLGEGLRLDVYCPSFKLAAEYHGRQHFEFVEFFHKDSFGYRDARDRDLRKEELCAAQGITLVCFRYNDRLDEDTVFQRLLEGLRSSEHEPPKPRQSRYRGNVYYEAAKMRRREYNRKAYQRMKQRKNGR